MASDQVISTYKHQAHFDHSLPGKMQFFVRTVSRGSITAASEEAGLSVSTGSRWIADLEQVLGLKLYHRRGSAIQLTHAGQVLYERFGQISTHIQALVQDLGSIVDEPRGLVRICCTPIYAKEKLLPLIGAFNQLYKKIRFSLDIHSYGLKQHDRYDMIISAQTSYQPQDNYDLPLVKRQLLCEPFVVVASPDYLTCNGLITEPLQLVEHNCLYADSLTHTREWAFKVEGKTTRFNISDNLEVSDTNLLLEAARMGIGVAYLPRYVVINDIKEGKLVRLLKNYETSEWFLNIYYPQASELDHSCALFKDFLLEMA